MEEEVQNNEFLEWIAVYPEIFFKMMETIARWGVCPSRRTGMRRQYVPRECAKQHRGLLLPVSPAPLSAVPAFDEHLMR